MTVLLLQNTKIISHIDNKIISHVSFNKIVGNHNRGVSKTHILCSPKCCGLWYLAFDSDSLGYFATNWQKILLQFFCILNIQLGGKFCIRQKRLLATDGSYQLTDCFHRGTDDKGHTGGWIEIQLEGVLAVG